MRPRLITAENSSATEHGTSSASGFNEAAAHHRGKLSGNIHDELTATLQ